jgi:membrane associated rhomboid family serine protease
MPEMTAESILRLCGEAAPKPWFPSAYAKSSGVDRNELDDPLAALRLAGLVRIADWEAGAGQGYLITEAGRMLLDSPRALARLRQAGAPEPAAEREPSQLRDTSWERGETVRDALLSRTPGPATKALMAAQVVVFAYGFYLAQRANVPLNQYLMSGAGGGGRLALHDLEVSAGRLANGEWWRLITYCFAHGGALHLIFNLIGHQVFGAMVERMYGSWRLLTIWVLSGIGGGAAAALLNAEVPAVGSSGAVCGLIGAVIAGVFLNRVHMDPRFMAVITRYLMSVVLMIVLISLAPQVSLGGHLGGGVVGLIAGALCYFQRYGVGWHRWAAVLGLVAVPLLCVSTVRTYGRPQQDEHDFFRRVVPAVDMAAELTETMRKNLLPLVESAPAQRDAQSLEEAFRNIKGLRPELDAANRIVELAGPYHTRGVEDARRAAEKYVAAQRQLTDHVERCLRNPDNDVAERHALELINTEYRNARRQWQGLFK